MKNQDIKSLSRKEVVGKGLQTFVTNHQKKGRIDGDSFMEGWKSCAEWMGVDIKE